MPFQDNEFHFSCNVSIILIFIKDFPIHLDALSHIKMAFKDF